MLRRTLLGSTLLSALLLTAACGSSPTAPEATPVRVENATPRMDSDSTTGNGFSAGGGMTGSGA